MRISWLKLENDDKNFKLPMGFGMDVFSVDKSENVDEKIDELIANKYNTIILSNDVAGLSEKINKEYLYNKDVNIIISKDREKQRQRKAEIEKNRDREISIEK